MAPARTCRPPTQSTTPIAPKVRRVDTAASKALVCERRAATSKADSTCVP
jgi:hypothetical protein